MDASTSIDLGTNGRNGTDTSTAKSSNGMDSSPAIVSIDTLGFFETWSFAWVRKLYLKSLPPRVETSPESGNNQTNGQVRGEEVKPTLNISTADTCGNNADYLQDLYRHEEVVHGKINSSMLRVCFALCRNRLLTATGLYLLHLLTVIVAIVVFLHQVMWATNRHFTIVFDRYRNYYNEEYYNATTLNDTAHQILNETPEEAEHLLWHNINFSIMFVFAMFLAYLQRSLYESKLLSAAIMLRNACAGAVFETSLKSSVLSNVASYQTLALCAEDGDAILELIQKGGLLVGYTLGITICMLCGFIMVGFPTIWATIGVSVMLLIAYLLSMASTSFYRKSLTFQWQKMAIADEYCQISSRTSLFGADINSSALLGQREAYRNRFAAATSGQFWALFRSEALRPSFTGAITLGILLTFLSIMAAVIRIANDGMHSENIMTISFLFVYMVSNLMADWSDSTIALLRGAAVLDKVKTYLSRPAPIQPKNSPDDDTLKLSIQAATFKWDTPHKTLIDKEADSKPIEKPAFVLDVQQFSLKKNSIVGITGEDGSGKTSFILALLGHLPQQSGNYRRSGAISYYPEKPYMLNDCSIQKNVMFPEDQNTAITKNRYNEVVSTLQMHMNRGFDRAPMVKNALDDEWLQKISLARALYEESDNIIVLENPLSSIDSNTMISDLFSDAVARWKSQGKTVVVVSQDDNVLRHCEQMILIENGTLNGGSFSYDKIKSNPVYKEIVRNNRIRREASRNGNLTNNLQTNLNTSTEDLVTNENDQPNALPVMFNPMETFYLIILNLFLAFIQTMLPLSEMIYYMRYDRTLSIVLLIFAAMLGICNILGRHYVHRTARRSTKRLQCGIFDRLLNTTTTALNESIGVFGLNAMLESNFSAFSIRGSTVHSCMVVLLSAFGLMMINGFWSLFTLVIVLQCVAIYFVFRNSVTNSGELETSSRQKLYENVHNDLEGRKVLQSFNHIRQSRNRIFALIDANSSFVLLNKSIIFSAQFIFTLFQVINLPPQMFIVYHDVFMDDTSYMIALYLFFLLTHHGYKLIDVRLNKILSDQKLRRAHNFKIVADDISTLKYV